MITLGNFSKPLHFYAGTGHAYLKHTKITQSLAPLPNSKCQQVTNDIWISPLRSYRMSDPAELKPKE